MSDNTSTAVAPPPSRMSQYLAWLLTLVAVAMLEFTSTADERAPVMTALLIAAMSVLVVGLNALFRRLPGATATENSQLTWVLSLGLIPFGLELFVRLGLDAVWPLELLLLAGLRDVAMALAVFVHLAPLQRIGCVLSTFLIIFASSLTDALWLQGVVVLFAVLGIWWLMGTYWDTLEGRLAATTERGRPWQWTLVLPLVLIVALMIVPVAGTQVHALTGFMPSSGGTQQYSQAARSGVGDGDALVAGTEKIRSFAPIEDAPFLSSHEPSLYDLFDDSYNEPVRNNQQDRAIALAKELGAKQKEHHLAKSEQAGRQFSTLRQKQGPEKAKVGDRKSDALLYVKGRLPLHLKLEVFDRFDGIDWSPEALVGKTPELRVDQLHGRPWIRWSVDGGPDIYATPETHALKIHHLDTNVIPAPTQLLGVHIDQVARGDFFGWSQPGVLKMERDKLPKQTAIQLQSRTVDPRLFPGNVLPLGTSADRYQIWPNQVPREPIHELAGSWTSSELLSWQKVQAIVEHLRTEYVFDPEARPPVDTQDTVTDFLFQSRRGPDYQFASAAVLLCRSIGISARLASGFYVSEEKLDRRSQHAPVTSADVHVWAEVYAGRGHWIPIEPTPGYELLAPPLTTWESFRKTVSAAMAWCGQHPLKLFVAAAGMGALWWWWLWCWDSILTVWWRLAPGVTARQQILRWQQLLEGRGRRTGSARPVGCSFSRWLKQLPPITGETAEHRRRIQADLSALLDWAAYAPVNVPCPVASPLTVCREMERHWSWSTLARRSAPGQTPLTTKPSPRPANDVVTLQTTFRMPGSTSLRPAPGDLSGAAREPIVVSHPLLSDVRGSSW